MSTENFVLRGLRSLGFHVVPVEVGADKTPDLLASDGSSTYLIEVKDKFPDVALKGRRQRALSRSGVWEEEESLGFHNALSAVLRGACAQLGRYEPEVPHFRLVWLHARGRHPEAQFEQFMATLAGVVNLIDMAEIGETVQARPCYYFGFSEFFRHREVLDGAFLSTDEKGFLLLNSLSERYGLLRESALCRLFHAVRDPVRQEREGAAYVADSDLDRSDPEAVLEYLRRKYARPGLIDFRPKRHSAETLVRRRSADEAP
jgi:hypothetical protein